MQQVHTKVTPQTETVRVAQIWSSVNLKESESSSKPDKTIYFVLTFIEIPHHFPVQLMQ